MDLDFWKGHLNAPKYRCFVVMITRFLKEPSGLKIRMMVFIVVGLKSQTRLIHWGIFPCAFWTRRAAIAQSVWLLATGWTIGWSGFESQRELGISLLDIVSRQALVPTQPPFQRIPSSHSLAVNRPGREADHSPEPIAEVKRIRQAIPPLMRLHGLVLS
jgi:hypothetical protein